MQTIVITRCQYRPGMTAGSSSMPAMSTTRGASR